MAKWKQWQSFNIWHQFQEWNDVMHALIKLNFSHSIAVIFQNNSRGNYISDHLNIVPNKLKNRVCLIQNHLNLEYSQYPSPSYPPLASIPSMTQTRRKMSKVSDFFILYLCDVAFMFCCLVFHWDCLRCLKKKSAI